MQLAIAYTSISVPERNNTSSVILIFSVADELTSERYLESRINC